MKWLLLGLAVFAALALLGNSAMARSPAGFAGDHQGASVQLVGYGGGHHDGHHGGWHGEHHGYPGPHGGVYVVRPYPSHYYYPRPYYPYPYYYGQPGVTIYGPRVGVSIGF